MKTFNHFLLIFILVSHSIYSQDKNNMKAKNSLENEILKMNSLLYDVAFNKCDLERLKKIVSPDLEFYDDRNGLNTSFIREIASFNDRCSKSVSITRKLVSSFVHVLGDYGAKQIGVHEFYVGGRKDGKAKFIHAWERKDNDWIIKRVISYDHEPASN
jgi:hypothetical protein